VIPEIDQALLRLIRGGAIPDASVEVAFEAPTRDWAARRGGPAVNAYLYDIREDVSLRSAGLRDLRDERGITAARRRPIRHFRLSYLVTSWTKRAEDEHRLLAAVLGCLLRSETLPVTGSDALTALGVPIPVSVAIPPPETRSLADIWSALGGDLKPSLDVVITTPFPHAPDEAVAPPVTEGSAVIGRRLDDPDVVDPLKVSRLRQPTEPAR
jgi:hypothetical protein